MHSRVLYLSVMASVSAVSSLSAQGKFPPDSLVNARVIAKGTPVSQVVAMMRSFTAALGVRCTYCHVGEESQPLATYNFASDEKRPKRVARVMMQMATAINDDHLPQVPDRPAAALRVSCETCHRGVARPVPIDVIVDDALKVSVDSAGRAYRALFARYRDRGAYDFSDAPLGTLAQRLVPQGKLDDAIAVAALNADTHPTSALVPMLQGELFLLKRDTTSAVNAYRTALQRDPASPARQRLTQLGKAP